MKTEKRKYPIVGSRWYDATQCASIGKILGAPLRQVPSEGAWGINLARRLDPANCMTEVVASFDGENKR